MFLKIIKIYYIYLSALLIIIFQLINSKSLNFGLPYFLPLKNGNLLLIKENEFLIYDAYLSRIINFYSFNLKSIILNKNNNNSFLITKFSDIKKENILYLNNNNIYFFDELGKNIFSFDIENMIINSNIFLLDSYKRNNSDFYFILGINKSSELLIKLFKLNIDLKNIIEVKTKKYKSLFKSNMKCHIMNSTLYGKILACFYLTKTYPHFLYIKIYDINNELKEILTNKYFNKLPLSVINFNTIISENKKKVIIYFTYNKSLYFIHYLIDTNDFHFLKNINLINSLSLIQVNNNDYFFKNKKYYTFINNIFSLLDKETKIINNISNIIIRNNNITYNNKKKITKNFK